LFRAAPGAISPASMLAAAAAPPVRSREVYDAGGTDTIPGTLVRSEGDPATGDPAADEAYNYSGDTYDFYLKLFQRNSIDGQGITLVSSVHVTENGMPMDNAFWNGSQMAYGDGDGIIFQRFTRSLDVIGHELTHGVVQYTSNLLYYAQSGALNEHFADVFGVLIRQWKKGQTALNGSWLVGPDLLTKAPTRRALRDMENPGTAFVNDPYIGTDPQPAHMKKLYKGAADNGGVHINSGIPNRAFVLFAKALKGKAWDVAGHVWYDVMRQLWPTAQFRDCARLSVQVAATRGAAVKKAVKAAWKQVGITV
jgi:Zn-dependent metalloprotease